MQRPLSSALTVSGDPWSSKVLGNNNAPHDLDSFSADSCTTQPQIQANDNNQHQDSWVDQPLTRDGRARVRVFIACLPCRKNKRRCDGTRPICSICRRKGFAVPPSYVDSDAPEALKGYCTYDITPKRRGPDRTPRSRLKRNQQIDDDERPTKRRHTTQGETLKQEPQRFGGVARPLGPNEEAQPTVPRTIPPQSDRSSSSINLTVATFGPKWKRQDTEESGPSTIDRHLQAPVLIPEGAPASSPSLSASCRFIPSSLLVTKDPFPSIVVPGLGHELALRSVPTSKSYSPVSSLVTFDSLGQPIVSPNPLPVLDLEPHYADCVLPISDVQSGSSQSPYSTSDLLSSEYDFRRQEPFIQYGRISPFPIFSLLTPF